jgi:hypothetical protein
VARDDAQGIEKMRIDPWLDDFRVAEGPYRSYRGDDYGAFLFPGPCNQNLKVIASPGDAHEGIAWEHVSVSLRNRCPNWEEMCFVKALFWEDDTAVMQLHPPKSEWINNHLYCLHLWRPLDAEIPLPPGIAVGYKELNPPPVPCDDEERHKRGMVD